jgi:hypothetical protein
MNNENNKESSTAAGNIKSMMSDARINKIRSMEMSEIMTIAEKHAENFQQIHESIMSSYKISGSISESQEDTMQSFIVQFAPEVTAETNVEEAELSATV